MRASLWVALGCGAVLAAAHATAPAWSLAASVAAFAGLAVAVRFASRRPGSRAPSAVAVLLLCALAVLPGGLGQGAGALAWAFGLVAAAGVLAVGAPEARPAKGTLGRHPAWLAAAALLLAALAVAPWLVRRAADARFRLGAEWAGPSGLLVAGLAILLPFAVLALAAESLRRPEPASDAPDGAADAAAGSPAAPSVQSTVPEGGEA